MLIPSRDLHPIRKNHPEEDIALRLGCYDVLHAGHRQGIEYAKTQADILVVGVMPDEYIRKSKGNNRPVLPLEARLEAIDRAEGVDYSLPVSASTLAIGGLFLKLRPDVYVEDKEHAGNKAKQLFLQAIGIRYIVDERQERPDELVDISSSKMIEKLGIQEAIRASSLTYGAPAEQEAS